MKKVAFTLCSNNYLAQAKTLGDSLLKFNPDYKFIIGLVDRLKEEIDYSFFYPHEILPFDKIDYPILEEMVSRYNIVEFNTAVKPFYFQFILSQLENEDLVFYVDPDIEVFSSFSSFENVLLNDNFLLTPHILYPLTEKGSFEQLILNVGVFNLGFLGLKKNDQTGDFLNWWGRRLEKDCRIDFPKGLFVDQIWVNFLPVLFEGVHILKDPGCNIGYWNFEERFLSHKKGHYFVNESHPLVFFHFSSYNPLQPEKLCRWLDYSFEKRTDLLKIYQEYTGKLLNNRYEEFSKVERGLAFKENHPHFDKKEVVKAKPVRISLLKRAVNKLKFWLSIPKLV